MLFTEPKTVTLINFHTNRLIFLRRIFCLMDKSIGVYYHYYFFQFNNHQLFSLLVKNEVNSLNYLIILVFI